MKKGPSLEINDIPNSKNPLWQEKDNRFEYEEDLRIGLYDVIENVSHMSDEEREHWKNVLEALGELALYYKHHGYDIHIH